MADTGLNIKLFADDKEFKKSLKDLESESKAAGKSFKTFSEQAKNLKGDDKVRAMSSALKALEQELSATTSKAALLKNKLNEVGNDSKLGKSSAQYKQLQKELEATENKASILKGKIAEIGSGKSEGALGGLTGALEKFGVSADSVNTAVGVLVGKGLAALGKAALEAVQALGQAAVEAVKITAEFDHTMSAVQAFSGGSSSDLAELREEALELGAATKYSANEVASSMTILAKAGWGNKDIQAGMKGILDATTASGESIENISSVLVSSLNAFGAGADQAGRFGDMLVKSANSAYLSVSDLGESLKYAGPMASTFGASLAEVNTALVAMAKQGIKGSGAGNAAKNIMLQLSTNAEAAKAFEETTGKSITDAQGNFLSLSEIFSSLRSSMQGYTKEQKVSVANTIAGKQATSGLLAVLNMEQGAYDDLQKSIENSVGSSAEAAEKMQDNLQGDVEILKSKFQDLQIDFADMFTPMLRGLTQFAQGAVDVVDSIFDDGIDTKLLEDVNKISKEVEDNFKEISKLEVQLDFPDLSPEVAEFKRSADFVAQYAGRSWDSLSGVEQTDLKKALDDLAEAYPPLKGYIDETTGAINLQGSGFKDALTDAKEYYEYLQQQATLGTIQEKIGSLEGDKAVLESEKQMAEQVVGVWDNLGSETTFQGYINGLKDFRSRILPSEQEKLNKDLAEGFKNATINMSDILIPAQVSTSEINDSVWNILKKVEDSLGNNPDGLVDFYSLLFGSIGKDGSIDSSTLSALTAQAKSVGLEYGEEVWSQVAAAFVGHDNLILDALGFSPDFINEYKEAASSAGDSIKTIENQQQALQEKVDKTTEALEKQKAATTALEKADARISLAENGLVKKDGVIEQISYIDELAKKYHTTSEQINQDIKDYGQGKGTKFVTEADIVMLDKQGAATARLTDEFKKQQGATDPLVEGEEDLTGASEDAAKAQEDLTKALEKTQTAEAKFAQTQNAREFAKGWTDALDKAQKSYDDYITKVTNSLAWDSTKEYKPIQFGDDGYVTFEQRNKNLEDYNKHQQERLDLLKKQLPEIEKISPTYAKAIYDAMASGDEAAIQGFYENIRNTLDKQGEQTLEELAAHFEEEQQKMQQLNHEMAVMSANFNKEQFNAMLSGQMTQEERGSYGAKLEDILGLGGITQEDVDKVNGLIDAIQAAGGDLSETTLSILNNTEGWQTDADSGTRKMFDALITSLESEGQVTVQELAALGSELGYDMSEEMQSSLQEALQSGDPAQVQALLQQWADAAGFTVNFNADGTVTINKDPEAPQKAEEAKQATIEDVGAALSGDETKVVTKIGVQAEVEPDTTNTGTEIAKPTSTEKPVNVTLKPNVLNAKEVDESTKEASDDAVQVDKVVNLTLKPKVVNGEAVNTVAKAKASTETTTTASKTVNEKVKRNVTVDTNIKTNIKGDKGEEVGSQFGKGVAQGIQSQSGSISGTASSVMNAAASSAGSGASSSGYRIGSYLGSGLASGINSQVGAVAAAAARLEAEAERVIRAKAQIASPSKVMKKLGIFMAEGFALGMDEGTKKVVASGSNMISSLINEAKPEETISKAQKIAKEFATSFKDELNKEIKKDKKDVLDSLVSSFDSDKGSKKRAESARSYSATVKKGSAAYKKAVTKEADEWEKLASDVQTEIDKRQSKIDSNQEKIDANNKKLKKKGLSKKEKKKLKNDNKKLKNKNDPLLKAQAKAEKEQQEYLNNAFIAAREEARVDAARKRIDDSLDAVDRNATLRRSTLLIQNGGKDASVLQELALASQEVTDAFKTMNDVLANPDATAEQQAEAYNTYAEKLNAATKAEQARLDVLIAGTAAASAAARTNFTINAKGGPLTTAQELAIANNEVTNALMAQDEVLKNSLATDDQRKQAAEAVANAYTEQYNAIRKMNAELIASAGKEADRAKISLEYNLNRSLTNNDLLSIAENRLKSEEKNLDDLWAKADYTPAFWDEYYQQLDNVNKARREQEELNKSILEEQKSNALEQVELEKELYTYVKGEALSEEEELGYTKKNLAVAQEWYKTVKNQNLGRDEELAALKEINSLTQSLKDAEKERTQEILDRSDKEIKHWKLIEEFNRKRKLTDEEELSFNKELLALKEKDWQDLLSRKHEEEDEDKLLEDMVGLYDDINKAAEKYTQSILDDATKKTNKWRIETEFAQKSSLKGNQKIQKAQMELNELEESYQKLLRQSNATEDQKLEMMERITSATEELHNAYRSMYQDIYRNMSIDKPFTAAEVRINETIENMESHITGLTDLMNARAAAVNRGLSDIALGYLNSLSPEEATNYFIELQNASDADFQKFNQTLTELALKEKEYSDIQQQTEEILTEKVANIAQAINQISTNGIKINGYYTGLANAGNSMQQATLNTAALEQGMTTMVTAMMGMSKKFDSMSGDLVTTLDDFSQEVASALNKVGISIDGREFGRIVRQYV